MLALLEAGHARAEATAAAADAGSDVLEDIVVTATRRNEELSKVPISIVAVDQATLANAGIKSISDLSNWVPGVEFDTSAGFGPNTLTNVAIRGVNSNVGTSTTGIYLDDVPLQTRIVALSYWGNPFPLIFDMDRVEVDRGPQGTLFGAGAEGGAIRFITPEPDLEKVSGLAHSEFAYTEHGAPSYEAGVAAGGPIVDDVIGIRASVWLRRDGGFVDRLDPITGALADANSNSTRSAVGRIALAIKPEESLRITPALFWQQVRNNDSGAYFEYLSNPDAEQFRQARLLDQPALETLYVPSLKIEYSLDGATLTSVTAFMHREGDLIDDSTSYNGALFGPILSYGNPLGPQYPESYADAGPTYLNTLVNLLTQEVRASSDDPDARLRWTVGAFFSRAFQTDTENVTSPFYSVNFFGLAPNDPMFYSQITSKDSQLAAFGQIDYRIIPRLTLTAGLRVSHNVAQYTQGQSGPIASSEFPLASGEQSQTPVIPKFELSYQATDATLLYASAGKGFRVGGANQPIPLLPTPAGCPLSSQPPAFQGDSLWSYELGSKNRLLDGRLQLDGSLFYVNWTDIQQQIYFNSCAFGFIANTGDATSKGFDLSLQSVITHGLSAGLSVAYTDARITRTVTFDGATLVQAGDAVGGLPEVGSPWNINANARYDFKLAGAPAFVRIEDTYHSRNPGPFNTFIPGSPLYDPAIPANPSYYLLNARLGATLSQLELSVFANNLTDQHPPLARFIETPTLGIFTDTTLRPRTYGAAVTYRF